MRRWMPFLMVAILGLLVLAGCGRQEEEPPFTVPPTPEPPGLLEPTPDIAAPVPHSPDELGTPGVEDTGGIMGVDFGEEGVVTADVAGMEFPLPEGTMLVEETTGEQVEAGAVRPRSNRATFLAPEMSPEQVLEFYQQRLPTMGFAVNEVAGGNGENPVLQFISGDLSGVMSVVTEGDTQGTRFTIAWEEMIE
jgi:hypothetical protein